MADSIREALTQAFTAAEQDPTETVTPVATTEPVVETPKTDTATAQPVGDDQPVIAPSKDTPKPTLAEGIKAAVEPAKQPVVTPPVVAPQPNDKAPASWKAEEKAAWATVPATARAAIMRREQETQRVLSVSAEARKLQQDFQQIVHPFIPLMEHHGVQPLQAITTLLHIRGALEVGDPDQKAAIMANLIKQFGVDIGKLDERLVSGKSVNIDQQPARIDPRTIPEFAPLFGLAEQVKAAQAAKLDSQFGEIEALPHYEAVRQDMADIMESFAHRGKTITLKKAYDLAVAADSELAPVTAAPAQTTVSDAAAILARSRGAASSVAGAPKTSPTAKPTDRRSQIEAAFAAVG